MVALKTFRNLSPERQGEIIEASLEEFAFHDYRSASLSNIVQKLDLGKGSFYRYFESKKSLYYYLIDHCMDKRVKHDQARMKGEIEDFFELVYHHLRSRIAFDQKEPLASSFLYNVLQERKSDELDDIEQYRKSTLLEMTQQVMEPYVLNGQVRDDLDIKVMAWAVVQHQLSFQDFIEVHFQQDFQRNIAQHGKLYNLPEDQLLGYGRKFVKILKEGLTK